MESGITSSGRSFLLFILAAMNIFSFVEGAPQTAGADEQLKEKGTMIATGARAYGVIPPMDRVTPARTQTATFALG